MNLALRVTDLSVSYAEKTVLKNITFSSPFRGITVIAGRSGSGKTTLLRAFNRINETFPHCVTTGTVEIDLGEGLEHIYPYKEGRSSLNELRSRVGMVFQSPNVLPTTIEQNIALPLKVVAKVPRSEIKDRIRHALVKVKLWDEVADRQDQPAQHLSGGQQQRLCLARTLALEPKFILLDEPTSSLDVYAASEIEELLTFLSRQYPILLVSHSIEQVVRLASRLLVLDKGRLIATYIDDLPNEEKLTAMLVGS